MANRILFNGKICDTQYTWKGKTVAKFIWNGKECVLKTVGPKQNSFTGTFSTPTKQADFMAITTTVANDQFKDETGLTGVSLPSVTSIGFNAFKNSPLTSLDIPKATTIEDDAFMTIRNDANTVVTMNKKYNSDYEKDRIFGPGNTGVIHFEWTNDDGTIYIPPPNTFTGSFSSSAKQSEFMNIFDAVNDDAFKNEPGITGISLPETTRIGMNAFKNSPITSLDLPKITVVDLWAFQSAKLTTLSLPTATNIQSNSFENSPLTSLDVRSAINLGDNAFSSIVNSATTEVWIPKQFNANAEKDRIFGSGNWDQITFHEWEKPWHFGDGHGGPHPTRNDWVGLFHNHTKQAEFESITTTVSSQQFMDEYGVEKISLPATTSILADGFGSGSLTEIVIPKVTTLEKLSLGVLNNIPATSITMNKKFNTTAEKDRIFNRDGDPSGEGWNQITFHWLNDDGTPAS